MKNEFRTIDIILSIILVVVMSVGIGICIVKQSTGTGELTMENCNEYLKVSYPTYTNGGEYTITFKPAVRFKVTDVKATVSVEGKSIGTQRVDVSFSATHDNPYSYKIVLRPNPPVPYEPAIDWYAIKVTVISISGQFSRGN